MQICQLLSKNRDRLSYQRKRPVIIPHEKVKFMVDLDVRFDSKVIFRHRISQKKLTRRVAIIRRAIATQCLPPPTRNLCANFVAIREATAEHYCCLLYTSPSPRDRTRSRMPSSA